MTNSEEIPCPRCGAPIPDHAPHGLCPKCVLAEAATMPDPTTPPGSRTPPPAVEEIASHFPDLEILELIGSGGMGAVYKVRQPKLDRHVALKILSHDLAADPAFAERFNREARVLARLNHPNIVTVFDFGTQGPFCFLLMEYVDGVNLRQAMQAGGFTPADSLSLVQDICGALKFAHEEGILHRDIKPENVLIDSRGRVKIADFGIAKLLGEDQQDLVTLTIQGAVLGSPHYMAPEQIETPGDVDQRADIYSLGVVFYELLTGELPIGRFAPPSERSPMDARIDEVVMRTLEKEREARFQSAGEVGTRVEALTRSPAKEPTEASATAATPAQVPEPPVTPETAGFATASAILTGVSLLLLAAAMLFITPLLLHFSSSSPGELSSSPAPWSFARFGVLAAVVLLPVGILALLGLIFGSRALREIRQSQGRKRGFGRAMFSTLTWPVLVMIPLTAALVTIPLRLTGGIGMATTILLAAAVAFAGGIAMGLLVRTVGRWAKAIPRGAPSPAGVKVAITVLVVIMAAFLCLPVIASWLFNSRAIQPARFFEGPASEGPRGAGIETSFFDTNWRNGRPEIEMALSVAPGQVATINLVRNDPSGSEEILDLGLRGYVVASDLEPFQGVVKIGSEHGSTPAGRPMVISIEGSDGGGVMTTDSLPGNWVFDQMIPGTLELSTPGRHSMKAATLQPDAEASSSPTATLSLLVVTRPRSGPGVPAVKLKSCLVGAGRDNNWIERLKKENP